MKIELDNKVVIILKYNNRIKQPNEIPQGYIVSRFNPKQLASAREWGTTYEQTNFGTTRKIEPKEIILDNEGFTIDIVEEAGYSSQGGKLSFWNCVVSKDSWNMLIGIDQSSLLSLIRQSTIERGIVQQKCSLFKNNTAGAIHPGMEEWGGLVSDGKKSARKTTKYIPGHIYTTKTTRAIYLGKVYGWYTHSAWVNNKEMIYDYKPLDEPVEKHLMLEVDYGGLYTSIKSGEIQSLKDLYDKFTTEMEDLVKKSTNIYELSNATKLFGYSSILLSKPIPREDSDIQLDNTNSSELLDEFLMSIKNCIKEYQGNIRNTDNLEFMLLSSANSKEFTRPDGYIDMLSSKLYSSVRILAGEDKND